MPRHPPRSKKAVDTSQPSAFLDALKFVSVAAKEIGPPYQTNVKLAHGWAIMSDGTLSAGHKITEELFACPHTARLIDALTRCGEAMNMTQLDGKLSVKSGKFRALVPCVDAALMPQTTPDAPIAAIDDRLRAGLQAVGILASESAQHVVQASVLLQSGSLVATDRHLIFEYWHGIDLPPGLALPKVAVNALVKKAKKLTRFGFTPGNSATFYFEDDSWIKTQLYSERWPDVSQVLNVETKPWPMPEGFFAAIDAILPFSEDGFVRFDNGVMRSHDTPEAGASYEVLGLPKGPTFDAKRLKLIQPYATSIDFFAGVGGLNAYFFGENMRGALTGIRMREPAPIQTEDYAAKMATYRANKAAGLDDDIPF